MNKKPLKSEQKIVLFTHKKTRETIAHQGSRVLNLCADLCADLCAYFEVKLNHYFFKINFVSFLDIETFEFGKNTPEIASTKFFN